MAVSIRDGSLYNINRTALSSPALTNQYQVDLFLENQELAKGVSDLSGISNDFFNRNIGISCYEASLPTSSFATAEVKDNFQGIGQQFAHTRFYVDSSFSFYVDKDYTSLLFFESWMDFISGLGSPNVTVNEESPAFYRRFRYPDTYKCRNLYITPFNKNLNGPISYQFFNAFPKSIQSVPVSYGPADILKVTVTFAYDRYILKRK